MLAGSLFFFVFDYISAIAGKLLWGNTFSAASEWIQL